MKLDLISSSLIILFAFTQASAEVPTLSAIIGEKHISLSHDDCFHSTSYHNNQVDHQYIKDSLGEYQVWYHNNQVIGFEGTRWRDGQKHRALFAVAQDGKAYLVENSIRNARLFMKENQDPFAIGPRRTKNECESKQDPFEALSGGLQPITRSQGSNSTCNSKSLRDGIKDALKLVFPDKTSKNDLGLAVCLAQDQNPLHLKLGKSKAQEVQKKIDARYARFNDESDSSPTFTKAGLICKDNGDVKKNDPPATAMEPEEIAIYANHPQLKEIIDFKGDSSKKIAMEVASLYAHEVLHLVGLDQSQEKLINEIVEYCQNNPALGKTFLPKGEFQPIAAVSNPSQAKKIEVYTEKAGAAAPGGMAQAGGVGRAQSLAGAQKASMRSAPEINQLVGATPDQQKTVQMVRSGGLGSAVQISRVQSAPLREYVNTAMDTFVPKAEAASVRRGLASTTSTNSKSMLGKKIVGRNGKEYTVVEEYLADEGGGKIAAASAADSRPSSTRTATPSTTSPSTTSAAAGGATGDSELSGSSGGAAPSLGAASAAAPIGGAGGLRAASKNSGGNSARTPASAARASGGSDTMMAETLNIFTEKQYTEIKRELNRPDFQDRLREADITILDTNGGRFGAEKGKVIYLDKGNRFIRMR